jgi:intracellular multiplication protein IcmD
MRFWPTLIVFSSFAVTSSLYATGSGEGIGSVAKNISLALTDIGLLINGAAYVAGLGFALAGMLKFKAHKDNPQQVPLSTGIVLFAVGAGLVFIPSLLKSGGHTLFGSTASEGSAAGTPGKGS